MKARKQDCVQPDCHRRARGGPWCPKHADPETRPACAVCGGPRGEKATMCRPCGARATAAKRRVVGNGFGVTKRAPRKMDPAAREEQMALIAATFRGASTRQGDARHYTAEMARLLVGEGVMTRERALALVPYMDEVEG